MVQSTFGVSQKARGFYRVGQCKLGEACDLEKSICRSVGLGAFRILVSVVVVVVQGAGLECDKV